MVAGVGRALDAIEAFRFDDEVLAVLEDVVDGPTLEYLSTYRFSGDIWGYAEGEAYFAHSPILVAEATFAEAVVLETVLLSIYNHDSAIASAASRMTMVAGDRPCIEMGSRRTHEEAAVAAARAAYVAGFATTSNLAARHRYGVPTAGTSAHSFTLLHDSEADAFRAQVDSLGRGTTLLVDTYDVAEAVRLAVEVAGPELGAVRLDSGDLGALAHEVRAQLDSLGATDTRIVVTSDLDEFAIAALATAPVDGYGVGTQLVTGSGHPTSGFVYKLVARENGAGRAGVGGQEERRQDLRRRPQVRAAASYRRTGSPRPRWSASAPRRRDDGDDRPLLVPLVRDGEVVGREPLDAARERHVDVPRRAARRRPADVEGRPRHPDRLRRSLMALLTCDFFSEALERGTSMTVVLPQPTEDQIGVAEITDRRPAARALPAARPLRRPHGLAPLHLDRALRDGRRPGGRDARGRPQLLRQRGARAPLLGLRLRGAADDRRALPPGVRGSGRRRTSPDCPWAGTARSSTPSRTRSATPRSPRSPGSPTSASSASGSSGRRS